MVLGACGRHLHPRTLKLGGFDGLAPLRKGTLFIKVPPLLDPFLLPAMDLSLRPTPLLYGDISVGLRLSVIRPKVGAQRGPLKLQAPASAALRPPPGPSVLLPEGLLPVL